MVRLEIRLLGGFEARRPSGERLQVPSTKAAFLLAYLALSPQETHLRDRLVALLWSEGDDKQGRANLRQALWILRKCLDGIIPLPLVSEGDAVRLDGSAIRVDAVQFERLIAEGTPEALEQAVALYTGDLLEGMQVHDPGVEEFLFYERERLRGLLLEALRALLGYQSERGQLQLAVQTGQRLLTMDPLDEQGHRALIRLHGQQGHHGQVLRQYERCREILARELDVTPEAETERLIDEIARARGSDLPAPASSETPATGNATQAVARPPENEFGSPVRWQTVAAAVLVIGVIAGSAALWRLWETDGLPAAPNATVLALPAQPSIAVLPFDNLSGDPQQEYFSDGISDDLITGLAKFGDLFVIDRKSSFAYKNKGVTSQEVARDLGVAYLLQGSVRRDSDRVWVNVQLIDAASGRHLWAEHYERAVSDIFAIQSELIEEVIAALEISSSEAEQRQMARIPTDNLKAYDFYLRAEQEGFYLPDPATLERTLNYYARAIELDPEFAEAYAGYARTAVEVWRIDSPYPAPPTLLGPEVARQRAYDTAGQALKLDPENAVAYSVLALLQLGDSRHEEAIASARKAVALEPNNADAYATLAQVLAYSGEPSDGLTAIETALTLDPKRSAGIQLIAGIVHYTGKDYGKAVTALEAARDAPPNDETSRIYLAAAYAHEGRMALAKAELDAMLSLNAMWSLTFFELFYDFYRRDQDRLHHIEGLKKAGVPVWPFGFEGLEQDLLTGKELISLVLDQTWFGRHRNGAEFFQHTDKRGKVAYRSANSFLTGTARIKDDMLCQRFDSYFSNRDLCGRVYRNPQAGDHDVDDYVYVSPDSLKYFSLLE